MKISKVRIENFRCVRELDLDLDETTVLIGANNGYGKTSLLEAFILCLYGAEGLFALPRAGRWRLRLGVLVDDFTKLDIEAEIDIR